MNLLFLFLLPLLLTLMILFVKTSTQPIFTFLLLMSLPHFSNTSLLHQPASTPSVTQALLQKENLFDLPNIEQLRTIEYNPHHWLTTNIFQILHFQYQFFSTLNVITQTEDQFRIYSLLLRKVFGHNYQLIWDDKFQDARVNVPYASPHFGFPNYLRSYFAS